MKNLSLILASALCLSITGCGASASKMRMSSVAMSQAAPNTPAPLERSEFSKNPFGQLTEDALQKILESPIDVALPARVGVLPVVSAADWRGPSPDFGKSAAGVTPLVKALRQNSSFTLVTQMMAIPSGALGMEALREIAARYRLRYLVLYREVISTKTRLNPWAFGYATGLGALFLPGKDYSAEGYLEASMFDVKTGILMFTSRRSLAAAKTDNEWHESDKLKSLASAAIAKFAPDLGGDVIRDLLQYKQASEAEAAQRMAPQVQSARLDAGTKPTAIATQSEVKSELAAPNVQ